MNYISYMRTIGTFINCYVSSEYIDTHTRTSPNIKYKNTYICLVTHIYMFSHLKYIYSITSHICTQLERTYMNWNIHEVLRFAYVFPCKFARVRMCVCVCVCVCV